MSEKRFDQLVAVVANAKILVGAVGALLAAASQIVPANQTLGGTSLPSATALGATALAALGIAVLLQLTERKARSRFRDPDAVTLQRREHIVGRVEDMDAFCAACETSTLVRLVGESGTGKSTLLVAGVVPRLRTDPTKTVIYLSAMGSDWIVGPEIALTEAAQRQLDIRLAPGAARITLDDIVERAGKTRLIVIFDQFDDYALQHRSRFVNATTRVLLSSDALAEVNSFWRDVRDQLVKPSSNVTCVFVARLEADYCLNAVRFSASESVFPLDRIKKGHALPLLNKISDGAVLNPASGFESLAERLAEDLERDGLLPIQMHTAFAALPLLPALTTRSYEKQGGLTGLVALLLDHHIQAAARIAGASREGVLALIKRLTDGENKKTRPCSVDELVQSYPAASEAAVRGAVNYLEKHAIIRRFLAGQSEISYVLEHDYLAASVIELAERENRWQQILDRGAKGYAAAKGLAKWQELLPISAQATILFERVRGRVHYRDRRGYALASLLRLAFNGWTVSSAIAVILSVHIIRQQRQALAVNEDFDTLVPAATPELTDGQARVLRTIPSMTPNERVDIVMRAFASEEHARRFNPHFLQIVASTVGFDTRLRNDLGAKIETVCRREHFEDRERRRACSLSTLTLTNFRREMSAWEKEAGASTAACLLDGTVTVDDLESLNSVPDGSRTAVNSLLDSIFRTADASTLEAGFRRLFSTVASENPFTEQNQHALLAAVIRNARDPNQLAEEAFARIQATQEVPPLGQVAFELLVRRADQLTRDRMLDALLASEPPSETWSGRPGVNGEQSMFHHGLPALAWASDRPSDLDRVLERYAPGYTLPQLISEAPMGTEGACGLLFDPKRAAAWRHGPILEMVARICGSDGTWTNTLVARVVEAAEAAHYCDTVTGGISPWSIDRLLCGGPSPFHAAPLSEWAWSPWEGTELAGLFGDTTLLTRAQIKTMLEHVDNRDHTPGFSTLRLLRRAADKEIPEVTRGIRRHTSQMIDAIARDGHAPAWFKRECDGLRPEHKRAMIEAIVDHGEPPLSNAIDGYPGYDIGACTSLDQRLPVLLCAADQLADRTAIETAKAYIACSAQVAAIREARVGTMIRGWPLVGAVTYAGGSFGSSPTGAMGSPPSMMGGAMAAMGMGVGMGMGAWTTVTESAVVLEDRRASEYLRGIIDTLNPASNESVAAATLLAWQRAPTPAHRHAASTVLSFTQRRASDSTIETSVRMAIRDAGEKDCGMVGDAISILGSTNSTRRSVEQTLELYDAWQRVCPHRDAETNRKVARMLTEVEPSQRATLLTGIVQRLRTARKPQCGIASGLLHERADTELVGPLLSDPACPHSDRLLLAKAIGEIAARDGTLDWLDQQRPEAAGNSETVQWVSDSGPPIRSNLAGTEVHWWKFVDWYNREGWRSSSSGSSISAEPRGADAGRR